MHLKRNNMKNFWTVPRTGTKYLAVASHDKGTSIPLIIITRDILKLVRTKKELRKALKEKQVLINHKHTLDVNYPVSLFDILTFPSTKKNLKAVFSEKGKMIFKEVPNKEAETKIFKVIGKKVLNGGKLQVNLTNGKNILTKEKLNAGDSVIFDLHTNKIVKIVHLEKGKSAFVIKGKHIGKHGKISEIIERGGKHLAKISVNDERINVWTKNLIVNE